MNDQVRYCVILPSGREGPFTVDDLRLMLAARKINADDRVFDTATRKAMSVCDLVPDHATLTDSGANPSIPAPITAAVAKPAAASSVKTAVVADAGNIRKQSNKGFVMPTTGAKDAAAPRSKVGLLIVTAIIAVIAMWLAAPYAKELASMDPPAPPELKADGKWTAKEISDLGGPWHFTIGDGQLTIIDPAGKSLQSAVTIDQESPYHAILHLKTPHKALGDSLRLSSLSGGGALIVTWRGGSELVRE